MPSRAATMVDVARRAGVHPATVSRALRKDPRITLAQRTKIERSAAELEYRINPLVAALMSTRRAAHGATYRATLGCITKYTAEQAAGFAHNYSQFIAGAREQALATGYRLDEFNLAAPGLTRRRATEILLSRNIRGLLVAPLHSVHDAVDLDWNEFTAVAMGYSLSNVALHRVAHNHMSGFAEAVRHCRAAGRRRPGLVIQRRVHEKVEKRWAAASLLDHLEHPGSRVPPLLFEELSEKKFGDWYRRHRPDVILGVNIERILRWLKNLGCDVPRTVGVVSLDRRSGDRGISGISQDYDKWGASSAEILIGMLQRNERGLPAKPFTVLIDGVWVEGRTLQS